MMLQKIRLVLLALGGVLVAGASNAHVAEAVAAGTVEDIEKFAWRQDTGGARGLVGPANRSGAPRPPAR